MHAAASESNYVLRNRAKGESDVATTGRAYAQMAERLATE